MESNIEAKTIFEVYSNSDFINYTHNERLLVSDSRPSYRPDVWAPQSVCSTPERDGNATPAPEQDPLPILRITTDNEPKSSAVGYAFGSDPDVCDVLLATNSHGGVSKLHFALQIKIIQGGEGVLIFKSHGRNGTLANSTTWGRTLVRTQRAISELDRDLRIKIGQVVVNIEFPDHSQHHIQWQQYWSAFCARYALQAPVLNSLELSSGTSLTSIPWQRRYHTGPEIGKGSYGCVYAVTHIATGEQYAAKHYHDPKHGGEINLPMLQNLSHDNIVKFYEVSKSPPALIMELVHGPDLRRAHKHRAVEGNEFYDLVQQVSDALAYLHERHITHRDLKPGNIMVSTRNPIHVKLVDFGVASNRQGPIESFVGTPVYNAPELRGRSYTNKVDIWSLGMIILEFSYRLPKWQGNWHECVVEHIAKQPQSAFKKFITHILQLDPRMRPSAAEILDCHFPYFYSQFSPDSALSTWDTHTSSTEEAAEQRTLRPSTHAAQHDTGSTLPPDETTIPNTEPCGYSRRRPIMQTKAIREDTSRGSTTEPPEASCSLRGDLSQTQEPTPALTPGGHSQVQDPTDEVPKAPWSPAPTPGAWFDELEVPWTPRPYSSLRGDMSSRRTSRPSGASVPADDASGVQDVAGAVWGVQSPNPYDRFVPAPTPGRDYSEVPEDVENGTVEDGSEAGDS